MAYHGYDHMGHPGQEVTGHPGQEVTGHQGQEVTGQDVTGQQFDGTQQAYSTDPTASSQTQQGVDQGIVLNVYFI